VRRALVGATVPPGFTQSPIARRTIGDDRAAIGRSRGWRRGAWRDRHRNVADEAVQMFVVVCWMPALT